MAEQVFNTIHIFGFGITQAIGKDKNVQTSKDNVGQQADAAIANVWSKKPADYIGSEEYHAINIFNNLFADFQPKGKGEKGFRVKYEDLDAATMEALATKIYSLNARLATNLNNPPVAPIIEAPVVPPVEPVAPVVEPPAPDMSEPTT